MARTGLYKSDVKRARDSLLAQNTNPSVDAVRVALGNTGSKTTIHKYLKELEEEGNGADGRKASISEALQDLVARLSTQLQDEASARIDTFQLQSADKERQHAEVLTALHKQIESLNQRLQHADTEMQQESAAHEQVREALQNEAVARHTAEQQVENLRERLAENDAHRQSIEEKHLHAREALEHYRQSVKEQRDQEQRRHEQQVQQLQAEIRQLQQGMLVKQDDITRLNQEGARLAADLSHVHKALYDQQSSHRQLEQKIEALQVVEQHGKTLAAQLADKVTQMQALQSQLNDAAAKVDVSAGQVRDLELALAAANAKSASQQDVVTELRAYLETRDRPASGTGK